MPNCNKALQVVVGRAAVLVDQAQARPRQSNGIRASIDMIHKVNNVTGAVRFSGSINAGFESFANSPKIVTQ